MEDDNIKENENQNQEEIKEEKEKVEDNTNEENKNEQNEENQKENIEEVPKENIEENQKEIIDENKNDKKEEEPKENKEENNNENIEEKQEDAQNEKNEEKIEEVQNEQKEEKIEEVPKENNEENQDENLEDKKEEVQNEQKEENQNENIEEARDEKIEENKIEEIKKEEIENENIKVNIEEEKKEEIEERQKENTEEIQNEQKEETQKEIIEIIQEEQNEQNKENENEEYPKENIEQEKEEIIVKENIEEVQNEQNEDNQKEKIENIQEVQNEKLEEIQNEQKEENQVQNEKNEQNINEVIQKENIIIAEEKKEENKIEIIKNEKIEEIKPEIKENLNEIKETQNKIKKAKIQMFGDITIENKKINNNNNTKKINLENNEIKEIKENKEKKENIPQPVIEHIEPLEDKKLNSKKIYIDKTSELNGKTLYHIKGDDIPDNAEVIRRYRDFDLLCIKLNHNWPCIFLPPISKKKLFSNTDKKVIDERVYQLQNFLQISSELPFIAQSPEYKLFLNKDITNSDAFQAQMKRLAPYNYKTISENYTKYFSGYKPEKKELLNDDKFSMFMGYVNGFIDRISEYKKQLVVFGDIPKTKIYRDSRLINHFINFEKRAMSYFVDNDLSFLYFHNNNASLKDSQEKFIKLIEHPFLLLSMWIRLKEIELLSMKEKLNEYKELVAKKNSYNNKVRELQQKLDEAKSGKVGFLDKIFVKGNVKEKYETELKEQTTETDYINNIVQIISDYLSVEFYKYFKDLTQNFYYIVRNFFSTQRENSNIAMDLWLTIKNERDDIPEKINEIVDVEEKEDEKEKADDKNIEINENIEIKENNEINENNEN